MRQPEDTKTIEIFVEEKRGRGRPRVENPLTAAQRQRASRLKRMNRVDGELSVTVMIGYRALSAMTRLMEHGNLTRQELIEKLILTADADLKRDKSRK